VPSNDPEEANALELLREDFQSNGIYAVHRLDRECSGVLLFARGKACEERLDLLFEKHELEREYLAILEGNLPQEKGTWTSYLYEKENYEVVVSDEKKGKLSITHFEKLRYSAKFSYLRLRLETGRKHQIRVHCKEAGYPITGDKRYGAFLNPAQRLMLHSHRLSLIHPFTKLKLTFVAPIPKSFLTLGYPH
jgi:tRNA pseudouridine32 synthase/23S rRNA pseudouridine746 synthase/23S rRNA pseudouridine1911/1915/1917 synthase